MNGGHENSCGAGSHGHEHDDGLDCTAVLADVWLILDGECDAATKARLQEHMDNCSPCIEAYGLEAKLKSLLNRKCGGERAPESLRERLTIDIRRSITVTEVGIEEP